MEKDKFDYGDYGAFEKHKGTFVKENLEQLEEASPLETTEHLQFTDKVERIKQVQQQRAKLELEKKKKRILAVKRARAEALKKQNETTEPVLDNTENVTQTESEVIVTEEEKIKDYIFDWEVPFMAEDDRAEAEKSKSKKAKKTKADKKNKKSKEKDSGQIIEITKTKISIGAKLIGIISVILIVSLVGVTAMVSYFISADTRVSAEENNMTINNRTASDTENRLSTVVSNVGMFLDLLDGDEENLADVQKNTITFFERNKAIVSIYLPGTKRNFVNAQYSITNEIDENLILDYVNSEEESVTLARNGVFTLENASPFFQHPLIALFYPFYSSDSDDCVVVLYSSEALAETFSSGSVNQTFVVNTNGIVLVHPDVTLMMNAADMSKNPVVLQLLSDNQSSEQFYYKQNDDGLETEYIGAYNRINDGSCGVITTVKTDVVLEAVRATTRRNIYLTIAILSLSILIVWFFSKSLTNPLKLLTEVTNLINQGQFGKEIFSGINIKRRDEIGVLAASTKNEQQILNTFSHLTNQAVTRAVIRKEIDFNAHLKDITIFFSDIRGFTAISDGFSKRFGEKSAGEIIAFLNDYMSRMVNCISITGGNVDKFEGDAIMACWGVLRNDNLDFELLPDTDPRKAELALEHENHKKQDAISAVKSVVAMRYALMKYNKDARIFTEEHKNEEMAQYKPHIRIGCGLNSGRATVGFMGSYDKMEFTSIGDSVNLASRTEASNKPCGTDGLITQDTYDLIKYDFIRCEENNYTLKPENEANEVVVEMIPVTFEVKGKGKQHFYGIVNMPNLDITEFFKTNEPDFEADPDCVNCVGPNGPKSLNEVRNLLGIPIPDFSGVNLDEEEDKTKITTG